MRLTIDTGKIWGWIKRRFQKKEKKKKAKREPLYEYELLLLSSINEHIIYTKRGLDHTYKDPEGEDPTEYQVYSKGLWRLKPSGLRRRFKNAWLGVSASFMAIYDKGQPNPRVYVTPNASARIINLIDESGALAQGLKDEFKEATSIKNLLVIFLIIAGVVMAYLVFTGQFKLGV